MKFTNNNELNSYLDELIDKHQLNLSISDLLGSIFSNSEITNKKEIELLASKFNTPAHEVFLSKISDYLDIDLSIEDNEEIFDNLIANSIHELDSSKYTNNPYYQLVKTSPIKNRDYELIWDHYYPYELFAYQDMSNKDYLEINSLGYFKNEFPFLALTLKGVTWMNITPNEIETMESAINQITGTSIVFGLGLGYLPFMISNKSDVKKVIVIENDKNIIKLFKDNLLDYFPHKNKIEIKEDDANNYLNKDLKMDYAFVDLWHSPEDGLEFYLKPDFSALGAKGILSAMGQAFFSLSVGAGCLAAYGSYVGKEVNLGKSVMWIAFFDTLVALLAGLAIFPAIYHYKAETGIDLDNNGIVLLFNSMPIIFNYLGGGGKVVSFLFFGMVSIAAITSLISLIEVISQYLIQRYKLKRKLACLIVGVFMFLVSIPIGISLGLKLNDKSMMVIGNLSFLEILDQIVAGVLIPIGALCIAISFGWFMFKADNPKDLFSFKYLGDKLKEEGLDLGRLQYVFAFMIKYLSPLLILGIDMLGISDNIFPNHIFSSDGLIVEIIGLAVIGLLIGVFFIFLKNKNLGDNQCEEVEE